MPEQILTITSRPRPGEQPGYNPVEPVEVFTSSWLTSFWKKTDLVPNWVIWSTAESGIGRAELTHRYGERFRSGDAGDSGSGFAKVEPVNHHLQFVKIVIGGSGLTEVGEIEASPPGGSLFRRVWVGQIDAQAAALTGSSHETPTGHQTLVANAIEEAVFGKHFVLESKYVEFYETEHFRVATETKTCRQGLTFNKDAVPNKLRSAFVNAFMTRPGRGHPAGSPVFWSSRDIVKYAIEQWPAKFPGSDSIFTIEISTADLERIPNWDAPVLETHGYKPLEILRRLLSRHRLLVWWLEINENKLDSFDRPTIRFRVQTTTSTPVQAGDKTAIPANDRWLALDVQSDASAHVQLEHDNNSQIDQLAVQGARRRNVMTLSFESVPGSDDLTHRGDQYWHQSLQEEYENGASQSAAYRALRPTERDEKKRLNDAERGRDKYKDVFRRFGMRFARPLFDGTDYKPVLNYPILPETVPAWQSGQIYSVGDVVEDGGVVYEVVTASGEPSTGSAPVGTAGIRDASHTYEVWYYNCFGNLRLLQKLPLLENHDYSGNNIQSGTTENATIGPTPPEELDMFVLFLIENKKLGTDEIETRYIFGEKLSELGLNPPKVEEDRDWSSTVRVVDDDTSFRVSIQGAKSRPHTIAKGTFYPLVDLNYVEWKAGQTYSIGQIVTPNFFDTYARVTGGTGPSAGNDLDLPGGSDTGYTYEATTKPTPIEVDEEDEGAVDWRRMLATICYEDDRFCESIYPVYTAGLSDNLRVLRLDLGDEYKLDWVQPGTIVDLTEAGEIVDSQGGYVRDDRARLEEIARRAYAFYSRVRGVLNLSCDYRNTAPPAGPVFIPGLVLGTLISKVRNGSIDVSGNGSPDFQPNWELVDSVITEIRVDFPYTESNAPIDRVGRVTMSVKTAFGELDPRFFVRGGKVTRGGRMRV